MRPSLPAILAALVLSACAGPGPIPDLVREGLPPGVSESDVFQAEDTCWYYRTAEGGVRLARDAAGVQVCTETG